MDVTVVVATYGDPEWVDLAYRRAVPSARAQGVPVVHVHGDTLHDARNEACAQAGTEWVVHLDADDELDAGYIDAVAAATGDIRAPRVRYIHRGRPASPRFPKVAGHRHDCTAECLPDGNWLVVGCAVRRDLIADVGGWRDFPWSEDWDLWVRCWQHGATIERVPAAVYRAHVRAGSRNRAPAREAKLAAHRAIAAANGLPVPA